MTISEMAQLAREYERSQRQDAPSDEDIAEAANFKWYGSERAADRKARSSAGAGSPANQRQRS